MHCESAKVNANANANAVQVGVGACMTRHIDPLGELEEDSDERTNERKEGWRRELARLLS